MAYREDSTVLAPEPPEKIDAYLCFNCEKIHLSVPELYRCYKRWVHMHTDYAVLHYKLAAVSELPDESPE
jgi:hypothetical protein